MPKSHFQVDKATSLNDIPEGGRIHVIGVCGVAMAQLAVNLAAQGYQVSGSDKRFYEPMGSLLKNSPVKLFEGYSGDNIPEEVDLVLIGNAIPYKFDEVAVVEERNLPYTLFPKLLSELLIRDKHSIVACGTHGKSTTSGMIAAMLDKLSLDPSYFIGGIALDLPESLHIGSGAHSVVEGDEYDSAFFAKVPKFDFYRPDTAIVNAIEFDHADIYDSIDHIVGAFDAMVKRIPASGRAICCIDFPKVKELVEAWEKDAQCEIITFGENPESDYCISKRVPEGQQQHLTISGRHNFECNIPLTGSYNARNALATLIVAYELGLDVEAAKKAIGSFQKVKRRQELRFEGDGVIFVEDFAHHPTAVNLALSGMREAYPDKKIWAVFEPRSSTSRRRVFQDDYIAAFKIADQVLLRDVEVNRDVDLDQELLLVSQLADDICNSGTPARALPNGDVVLDTLLNEIGSNDLILVMSNGSFDGLPGNLETALRNR